MVDLVNRVSYLSDISGLTRAKQAVDDLARSEAGLEQTTAKLTATQSTREKSEVAVAKSAENYIRANLATEQALARVLKGEQLLRDAQRQGFGDVEKLTAAVAAAKAKHEELTKAANDNAASMSLNRAQMMELTHVGKSLFDQLAAGQSLFRALSVEAGRIGQVLTSGEGGVMGSLRAMGSGLAGLATGWVGFGVAAAAGLGAAAVAVTRFQSQQDRLALSLNGAGRYAGVGLSGLTGIANAAGGRNPALGQGGATDLVAKLAGTGNISSGIMGGIADMTTSYARGTGQDMAAAGDELAKAFAAPSKGAETLNEKLGFLDAKTREHIEDMERQGNLLGAQQELLDKAAAAAGKMADRTWAIARAWEAISSAVGQAANGFATGIERSVNPTLADKLAGAINLRGSMGAYGAGADQAISNLRLGVAYKEYGDSRNLTGQAQDKATNDLSIQVAEILKRALPDQERVRDLNGTITLLEKALRDPALLAKVPGGGSAVSAALSGARSNLFYNDPLRIISTDSALSVQAIQAQTGAERTLIEARRAEVEAMRTTHDATQAAARSVAVWNEAIAKSNKTADDALYAAKQRAGLVGLTPYERARQEVINRYHDMDREAVTGPVSMFSPLDRSMTALDPAETKALKRAFGNGSPASSLLDAAHDLTGGLVSTSTGAVVIPHPAVAARGGGFIRSTYGGNRRAAMMVELGGIDREFQQVGIDDANRSLGLQSSLVGAQLGAAGGTASAIAGVIARQSLLNDLLRQGVPVTDEMQKRLDAYGKAAAGVADAQDRLARSIQEADLVRSGFHDGLRTFIDDLIAGKGAATAFRDVLSSLGSKLIDAGLNSLTEGLFGKSGTNAGLGGLLGSLFKFADGGVMTSSGPLPLRRYAGGGVANTPQLAMYGEGSTPEAFVPLPDGRRIPVAMQGGAGHTINVGGPVLNVQGSIDAATMPQVQAMMSAAIRDHHSQLQRNLPSILARSQGRYAA